MMNSIFNKEWSKELEQFFKEDQVGTHYNYILSLPNEVVRCELKIKSDLVLCGLPFFISTFDYLNHKAPVNQSLLKLNEYEGRFFKKGEVLTFELPFDQALTGERIALNLLQRASSIATTTKLFKEKMPSTIALLDTRKTMPGLRSLDKYAVNIGGGHNHRFSQVDSFMIKDNHKAFFGGLKKAVEYFQNQKAFYHSLIVEIHNEEEFNLALDLKLKHVMLDNFSPELIKKVVKKKSDQKLSEMTIEVSGGIQLNNINEYCIEGVDAISVGSLTHSPLTVDLSLKLHKI